MEGLRNEGLRIDALRGDRIGCSANVVNHDGAAHVTGTTARRRSTGGSLVFAHTDQRLADCGRPHAYRVHMVLMRMWRAISPP
jgi:hypothetical protein